MQHKMAMGDYCIIIKSPLASKLKKLLQSNNLLDPSRRLQYDANSNSVALPVVATPNTMDQSLLTRLEQEMTHMLGQQIDLKLQNIALPQSKKINIMTPKQSLKIGLKNLVSRLGSDVWIEVCRSLSCKRIAKKSHVLADEFRRPSVTLLYGEDGWVEHIDNKIRYSYDVTKCMFSAGNITEKLRIAKFDCSQEVVVDLYAGIGYFTLPYLVHAQAKHVHACEWNPDAILALKHNLHLNNVVERCTVHEGDNKQVCPRGIADRVNLGLIPSSEEGWPVACAALKPCGGTLHIHHNINSKPCGGTLHNHHNINTSSVCQTELDSAEHVGSSTIFTEISAIGGKETSKDGLGQVLDDEPLQSKSADRYQRWIKWAQGTSRIVKGLLETIHCKPWEVTILHIEHVKSYAPYIDHVVLDLRCTSF
ncbi:tRNA wybutosine-synthesizing protein 2 homolog isoform X2 [Dreissena polymorpha]|uniref:tRNA wybutosine-synthesizing protein 2 homolog isoform X2 n=1 Tax=Dreissena polymorpha TaxID=45954 RepID=UPI002265548C|nr:tRNA wybutosine-synthesizing protein 2 homolog isoform X2 [Dreissena polymorpha]